MEDGGWICDPGIVGIEGFLAVNRRVEDGENLVFELPFDYIKRWSEAKTIGRPRKGMTAGQCVDIALSNKKGEPIYLIEVKLKWVKDFCKKDIDKLRNLLLSFGHQKGGSLKSGFLSIHYQGTNRPYLDEKMDAAEEYVRGLDTKGVNVKFYRKVYPEDGFVERDDGKEWEYGSHIIELSRQNVRNA